MKRIVAILLTLLIVFSISACSIGDKGSNAPTAAQNEEKENDKKDTDSEIKDKSFKGLQKHMLDKELVIEADKTKTKAELIGAKSGYRYYIKKNDKNIFVEFYEYKYDKKATPDEVQSVYDSVSKDKSLKVLDVSDLNAELSKSGNFIMLYPKDSKYDYSEIVKEFKKF